MRLKRGDLVTRDSHNGDVLFRVERIWGDMALLSGVHHRLLADAPIDDLQPVAEESSRSFEKDFHRVAARCLEQRRELRRDIKDPSQAVRSRMPVSGRILHLDGDREYLEKCMAHYKDAGVRAIGFYSPESQQSLRVRTLIATYRPDVLVLTGHDGLKKNSDPHDITSYYNSDKFVEAVRSARKEVPSKDELVIVAGACQSYFETLVDEGANFASSPGRVLIHLYDPAVAAKVVSTTHIDTTVRVEQVISASVTGSDGMGGVDTRGTFRYGAPDLPGLKWQN